MRRRNATNAANRYWTEQCRPPGRVTRYVFGVGIVIVLFTVGLKLKGNKTYFRNRNAQ